MQKDGKIQSKFSFKSLRLMALSSVTSTVVVLAVGGCSTLVDRPPPFTGAERASPTGITYVQAVDYLNVARNNFQRDLDAAVRFDSATKIGVGVGVAGAGVATIFHSAINPILGFLTLGGLSYSANQIIDPKTLNEIYSAGVANLDCIDEAGSTAYQSTVTSAAALRAELPLLRVALRRLEQDVVSAGTQPTYTAYVTEANTNIASANSIIASIQQYLRRPSNVGEAMVSGVNSTITAVNGQLSSKAPSIDAIAQSGSILTSFINLNSGLRSQTQAAVQAASQGAKFTSQAAADPLEQRFKSDLAQMQLQLTAAQANMPGQDSKNLVAIGHCQAQFAVDAVVSVEPSGPIALTPGDGSFSLRITGKAPFLLQWLGDTPNASDVQVSTNYDQVTLSAGASAKAHSYSFVIVEVPTGKNSTPVQLSVGAAASPVGGGGGGGGVGVGVGVGVKGAASGPLAQQQAIIRKLGFNVVRGQLGLGLDGTVTSSAAVAWTDRVSKLENCFGMSPTTGFLSSALEDHLTSSSAVNAAGDCPAGQPAPTAPSIASPAAPVTQPGKRQPSGAPSNTSPVPPPPLRQ